MAALLFASYPAAGGSRFDRDYYIATHLPLVEQSWGPLGLTGAQGFFPSEDGAHVAVAVLSFATDEAIAAALASEATGLVLADLANFTDIAPVLNRGAVP